MTVLVPRTASWSASLTTQWPATCVTSLDPSLLPQPIPAESQTAPTTAWSSSKCLFTELCSAHVLVWKASSITIYVVNLLIDSDYMHIQSHTLSYHLVCHSRLGHKIQGVLCDGNSNEVVASTVVNCLKIDEGKMQKYPHCIFSFYVLTESNSSLSPSFHRNHHHCERRLCPCSKSPTDLWQSEKCHGVIVSYLVSSESLLVPGSLKDRPPSVSSGTLDKQYEKNGMKASELVFVSVYNCGGFGKCYNRITNTK